MKLLFILTYYTPHWTGLTQYAKLLGEGLSKKGNTITVLTTRHEPTLPAAEMMQGVKVRRMKPLFKLSRTIFSLELWRKLPSYMQNTDAVVIFLPSNDVFFATFLAKVFKKKIFLIHNGDLVLPNGFVNRVIERLFFTMTDISMTLCNRIIVNTKDYAEQSTLLRKHRDKWVEIYPPIAAIPLDSNKTKELQKKVGKHHPVIGFAGRFVEEKGFDILLKAIPLVAKKYPDVRFVYAGVKVHYESFFERCSDLIQQAGEYLIFLGKLDRFEMGSFYTMCDCMVISSRTDFFPFVQIESLLAGVPVVVTNIPGARVPVKRTKFGTIVPSEDPGTLAEGICELIAHRKTYDKYAAAVQKEFRVEYSLQKHEDIFLQN